MKLCERPRVEPLFKQTNIVIPLKLGQVHEAIGIVQSIGEFDPDKDYDIIIKPKKKARTLDQNAYLWTLIGKLAKAQGLSDKEVYRHYTRDYGVFEIMPVKVEAMDRWMSIWSDRGIGWCCEDLGECRTLKGYHNIKCIYGSSTYSTSEFGALLDAVIFDCRENGIPTDTPEEVARLKKLWEEAERKRNG